MAKNISSLVRSSGMLLLVTLLSACASDLQTKVSGHLNDLSKHQTVAILPVEASDAGQREMAKMFRQGLYANLKQSKFNLLEKYVVDSLLKQNHLNDPASFLTINPMQFGEILGADAIVFSRINKVERSYFIVHSSIELSVSVQMIDTRTGEILWRAEQTEHDFSGVGKIPTGIFTALLAPIQFVTNKFNLSKMTSEMVDKLTALVKKPENAKKETQFESMVIAKNATTDLKKIEELQQLKAEWDQALTLDEEMEVLTYQKTQSETLGQKKNSSPPAPIEEIQNEAPLKTMAQEVDAVEMEMAQLPTTPEIETGKTITPIPLNAYKTTLAIPTRMETRQSQEKVISGKNIKKSPASTFYTVQVGAYKKEVYAQRLLKKLAKKGYNVFVVQNNKKIYKVQIDKFENKQDAQKLAQLIQKKENLKNFVTLAG
ncbi:MAG: DUF799 family lipoprotein [Nitrospinae bacterium]|nr:DUF799 family lipoprotein [Nitrospinota bacterium]MBL7020998.1 DUF799 family lipoprotein [Nitrospinaceae bacterium]